ncbi:MAG: LicD family protein [Paludibacteraceae bacterium]|nr:LicD family protein [Paludibacteraceae bacterium]
MNKYIVKTVKAIGAIPGVKDALESLFPKIFHRYKEKERRDAYQAFGLEALQRFDQCMRENNFFYTLAFGSMLGGIREHGFIKHDCDIDTYMWIEDFTPSLITALQNAGFTWLYSYHVDDGRLGREDTFEFNGVHIDIFFLYPAIDTLPYCCDFVEQKHHKWMPRRIQIPITKERKEIDFETLRLFVPERAEEICAYRYGPNYMTPDPSWNWVRAKDSVVEWNEQFNATKHFVKPRL